MSFIGEIRPLGKGNSTSSGDSRPALLLTLGFFISSVATFAFVAALGAGLLGGLRGSIAAFVATVVVLAALVAADAGLFGWRTPMWHRQTPKWFMYRFTPRTTALLWGLDAGLVFSTIRVTSMSWAALFATFVGIAPWWTGAVYALAFAIPELIFDLMIPRRVDPSGATDPEPTWVIETLSRARPKLRPVGLITMAATGAWVLLVAVLAS